MKSMSRIVGTVLLSVLLAQPAPAQTQAPLTLGECIRRALERGFDMELQREDLNIATQGVPAAKSEFDPVLDASIGKSVVRSAADALLPQTRSEGINTNAGLSQRLITGATVGMGVNLDRSKLNPAFSALNPAYASDMTFAVRQPLLEGAGKTVNTANLRRAELGLDAAHRDYRGRALDVIQATENAYYQLAGAREQLGVFKASLELAEKLLDEAQSRHKAGMAIKLDLVTSQVGVANARRNVLEAENTVKAREDALLALIGRFEFDQALGPARLEDPGEVAVPRVEASYARAQEQYPVLVNAREAVKLSELDVKVARNQTKPALDLDVALGVNGSDGSARDAFGNTFERDNSSWQAGLTVTYPWGRRGGKARLRQSEAALRRQELFVRQLEQDVLVQVRGAVRDVETSLASVKLATETAGLASQQYEAERKRFAAGLSTSRRVLEAQTDLESARVAELQAKLNLQTVLAVLRRIEGSGPERYGIDIP